MPCPPARTRSAVAATALALAGLLAMWAPAGAQTEPTTTTTSTTAPPALPDKSVQVLDNVFKPRKVKVPVGTTVIWKWGGSAAHNVVVTKGPQKFKSKTFAKGRFSRTISKPGKYLIVCTLHPGMNMTLRATKAPPTTTTTTTTTGAESGA